MPPPCITLFPYTTLFRSFQVKLLTVPSHCAVRFCSTPFSKTTRSFLSLSLPSVFICNQAKAPKLEKDRKSTRLNSSHVKTSYAVFCLKKKRRKTHSKLSR